jgi:hypothetical protein
MRLFCPSLVTLSHIPSWLARSSCPRRPLLLYGWSCISAIQHIDVLNPFQGHSSTSTEASTIRGEPQRRRDRGKPCNFNSWLISKYSFFSLPSFLFVQLQFHPTRKNVLLSGSTDGLVNLYDINVTDEDDALLQVVNHGSIHHAGFLSETAVYALSHDETFSIHPITNPDSEEENESSPIQFGDLRPSLGCEYVVQTLTSDNGQGSYLAAGNTT